MEILDIDNAVLIRGNCLEVIPHLEPFADVKTAAFITDPPYGTAYVGSYNRKGETIKNDANLNIVEWCVDELLNIGLRDGLMFYSPRVQPTFHEATRKLEYSGQIIWDKKAPGMGGRLRYQHENVAVFGDLDRLENQFSVLTFYRDAAEHPHQKPVEVMEHLIGKYQADVIIDPFMGSGSTGVAALNLGRKFIGIELDEHHFETTVTRIRNTAAQGKLF